MRHQTFFKRKKPEMKYFSPFLWLLALLVMIPEFGIAQSDLKGDGKKGRIQGSLHSTRTSSRFAKQQIVTGLSDYRQLAWMDGNLVVGPFFNSSRISNGTGTNTEMMRWPKGPLNVTYVWGAFFFAAAEVFSPDGDTLRIVSDDLPGSETSNDNSHEYSFRGLPGYYNLDIPGTGNEILIGGVSEDVGPDGIPNSNDPGEGDGKLQAGEDANGNGILDLALQNVVSWFANSDRKETWPEYWPVGSYIGDDRMEGDNRPGKRAGNWNGEFGPLVRADQEIYAVMDDRENDEFEYYPFPNDTAGYPDGIRGLGLTVESRAYQWNARLAEDIIVCLYDINLSVVDGDTAQDLNPVVVGMFVDPDLGGSASNDNASHDQLDDITFAWNKLGRTIDKNIPTGYFGFAFLESPGLSLDGIDNDFDGLIDESQENGEDDDGDWTTWEDTNENGVYDNEDMNFNGVLDDGEDANGNGILDTEPLNDDVGEDGIGPDFFEYIGPDDGEADGIPTLGEPNFETTDNDESDQVGLTSFYLRSTANYGGANDNDFWQRQAQPGTFFTTSNFQNDISWTYGSGFVQFSREEFKHRYAIALMFGNDFNDILRNKRTMQVIYDNDYNFTKAPRKAILEGTADDGKVYLKWDSNSERSKDPIYGNDFALYNVYRSTDPSFTEIKTITDGFGNPFLFKPMAIFDIADNLTGLHPVPIGDFGVSYDMGTDTGLKHRFIDSTVTNGRTYYYAIGSLDKGYDDDFVQRDLSDKEGLQRVAPTETPINIQVDLLGRPVSFDLNTIAMVPTEKSAGWVGPSLSEEGIIKTAGIGTGSISVEFYSPLDVKTDHRYEVSFQDDESLEFLDTTVYTGYMDALIVKSITENTSLLNIRDPKNNNRSEVFLTEGFRVVLHNDTTGADSVASGWTQGSPPMKVKISEQSTNVVARDFELRVMESNADTAANFPFATNYQVWDVTDPENEFKIAFEFASFGFDRNTLDENESIILVNNKTDRERLYGLKFNFIADSDSTPPQAGDVYKLITRKGFDRYDRFEFSMVGNSVNDVMAANELDDIYTVPDPYIAVSSLERIILNDAEGRGDRRIDFVNLPKKCTIKIFTVSGKLVDTIDHEASVDNRRASWDLRNKEGLDISYGMYFYVVDAPGVGTKTGKFAVIK